MDKHKKAKAAKEERDQAEKDLVGVRKKRAQLHNKVGKATDKIIDAKEKFVRTGKGGETPTEATDFIKKKRKEAEDKEKEQK